MNKKLKTLLADWPTDKLIALVEELIKRVNGGAEIINQFPMTHTIVWMGQELLRLNPADAGLYMKMIKQSHPEYPGVKVEVVNGPMLPPAVPGDEQKNPPPPPPRHYDSHGDSCYD